MSNSQDLIEPIDCELICHSSSEHLNQVYAGFGMLANQSRAALHFTRARNYEPGVAGRPFLEARISLNSRLISIGFDMRDGHTVLPDEYAACDFVLKRSYRQDYISTLSEPFRVLPWGLNYCVYGDGDGWLRRWWWSLISERSIMKVRSLQQLTRACRLISGLLQTTNGRAVCAVDQLYAPPKVESPPRILFLTRVWDSKGNPQRASINDMRAECIRRMRREFGDRFTGGLLADEIARSQYPDCLAPESLTRKGRYLDLVKQSTVCIATRGLKDSNGWKLAEYVALSKCIVSEQLAYDVPGGFREGEHYLPFTTAEESVSRVKTLMEDSDLRESMMRANNEYYRQFMRPDKMVWNALETIFQRL